MEFELSMVTENEVSGAIIEVAIAIHRQYGPGLLESAYEALLEYELRKRGLPVQRQVMVPLVHEGLVIKDAFRADLIVGACVIVELKSTACVAEVHFKQLLTYLRVTGIRVGLLINFNEAKLMDGLKRVVNKFKDDP